MVLTLANQSNSSPVDPKTGEVKKVMLNQDQTSKLVSFLRNTQFQPKPDETLDASATNNNVKVELVKNTTADNRNVLAIPIKALSKVNDGQDKSTSLGRIPNNLNKISIPASCFRDIKPKSPPPSNIKFVQLSSMQQSHVNNNNIGPRNFIHAGHEQMMKPIPLKVPSQKVQTDESFNRSNLHTISNQYMHTGYMPPQSSVVSPEEGFADLKRKRKGKGLRHFSTKVCEKVQRRGITTYNEVADELVSELTAQSGGKINDQRFDHKNIRRRVYDALNVLMAMNIITKDRKEIKWLGLPTNCAQESKALEAEKRVLISKINAKTRQLHDLVVQQVALKTLVNRNVEREEMVKKCGNSHQRNQQLLNESSVQLPFIVINTSKKTVIDCSISSDKREYLFNFDNTFEIHDDMEILKRMGVALGLDTGNVSAANLEKIKSMLPKSLHEHVKYLAKHGLGTFDMSRKLVASVAGNTTSVVRKRKAASLQTRNDKTGGRGVELDELKVEMDSSFTDPSSSPARGGSLSNNVNRSSVVAVKPGTDGMEITQPYGLKVPLNSITNASSTKSTAIKLEVKEEEQVETRVKD